jgi:hypothetical protein
VDLGHCPRHCRLAKAYGDIDAITHEIADLLTGDKFQ